MADSASIGDLFVRIGAKVEDLLEGLKKSTKALTELKDTGVNVAGGISASTLAVGVAAISMARKLEEAVLKSINKLEELGKTSQQIGVSVEALSRLEFSAKKAGVAADELSTSIKLFAKDAGKIRDAKEAPDAFALALRNLRVGLTDSQGQVRDTSTLILDLADRFSRMPDGVQKTSLALELFGRSGASIIPFLNQGREKIAAYMAQSDALGLTMGKEQTDAALKFNNALRSISGTVDSLVRRVVGEFLPAIENLATQVNAAVKNTNNMTLAMDGLRVVFNLVVGAGQTVLGVVKAMAEAIGGTARLIKAIATGDWKAAMAAITETARTSFDSVWNGFKAGINQVVGSTSVMKTATAAVAAAAITAAVAVKEPFKAMQQTAAQAAEAHQKARQEYLQGLVLGPSNAAEVISGLQAALQRGKITFQEFNTAADEALGSHRRLQLAELDAVMSKSTATMQEKMKALETAVRGGGIGFIQYGKDVEQVERQNQQHMLDTASLAASTISSVFKNNKAAAVGAAMINTAVGITRTFRDVPFPLNWAQAALIAATGAAQVSAISSASEDGSGGGAASVSQSVATAQQPQVQEQRQMTVQGFSAKEFYSGDAMRVIAQGLLDFQRDGGQVILK